MISLGQRLGHHEDRVRAWLAAPGHDAQLQPARPCGGDDALGDQPGAVGQVGALPHGQAPHRGGVPPLRAVQDHPVGGQGGRVTQEDRRAGVWLSGR